jgi:protein-ribulosamine 3-kinase
MIPGEVLAWLVSNQFGELVSHRPVGGGCINNGQVLQAASGRSFFLKTNTAAPQDMFACEVEGLYAIRGKGGPTVPEPGFLLMEDLAPAPQRPGFWTEFGHRLAALHNHTGEQFGFFHDNYIGSTPQPNPWCEDGYQFFAQHRLVYMAGLARDQGGLDEAEFQTVARLAERVSRLVPEQSASLTHGDLWSGNAMTDSGGGPALIDPAAHYGWAEAELAMTTLFGSFPEVFYRAYGEIRPLEPGYASRFPIYNLYHLLNHLVLFGRGYLGQVKAILARFV